MGAEVLLYCYGAVCLGMLVFNAVYLMNVRAGDRRLEKRTELIREKANEQLQDIRGDLEVMKDPYVSESHLKWLQNRLTNVNYLLAFDRFLDELDYDKEESKVYLMNLKSVILYLASVYLKREETQAAYFCRFVDIHRLQRHMEFDQIQRIMLSYLKRNSLYCRINSLKALCDFGSPEIINEALVELCKGSEIQLHEKVVTEALFAYGGDVNKLIDVLWENFDGYTLSIQRAVLDYIRFKSGNYKENMQAILCDSGQNKELRFSAIRYFGRYPDSSVEDTLVGFVKDKDPVRWEYAAISASSLASYPGENVVKALLEAMSSPNWYIRFNASAALEAHGLSYEEMLGVFHGNDRYAREMLVYRLESKRLAEQEASRNAQPQDKKVTVSV